MSGDPSPAPREPLARLAAEILRALGDGSFARLRANRDDGTRETWRRVSLRAGPHLSGECVSPRGSSTRNIAVPSSTDAVLDLLGTDLRSARLVARGRDWELSRHAAGLQLRPAPSTAPAEGDDGTHDRAKRRPTETGDHPWLADLGLAAADGTLKASSRDKWRQVCRYVEIVDSVLGDDAASIASEHPLRVVDGGCGRGVLTFALHAHLDRRLPRGARTLGVERRQALVEAANGVAATRGLAPAGPGARGLAFAAGDIGADTLAGADLVIALHACDTATDDAIAEGIGAGARWILAAPCCHRELRSRLQPVPELAGLLRHGIHANRFAEMATDALRGLLLERAGYRVKILEWVDPEHTPRNTLIAATLGQPRPAATVTREIEDLLALGNIKHQHLLDRLGPALQ